MATFTPRTSRGLQQYWGCLLLATCGEAPFNGGSIEVGALLRHGPILKPAPEAIPGRARAKLKARRLRSSGARSACHVSETDNRTSAAAGSLTAAELPTQARMHPCTHAEASHARHVRPSLTSVL